MSKTAWIVIGCLGGFVMMCLFIWGLSTGEIIAGDFDFSSGTDRVSPETRPTVNSGKEIEESEHEGLVDGEDIKIPLFPKAIGLTKKRAEDALGSPTDIVYDPDNRYGFTGADKYPILRWKYGKNKFYDLSVIEVDFMGPPPPKGKPMKQLDTVQHVYLAFKSDRSVYITPRMIVPSEILNVKPSSYYYYGSAGNYLVVVLKQSGKTYVVSVLGVSPVVAEESKADIESNKVSKRLVLSDEGRKWKDLEVGSYHQFNWDLDWTDTGSLKYGQRYASRVY